MSWDPGTPPEGSAGPPPGDQPAAPWDTPPASPAPQPVVSWAPPGQDMGSTVLGAPGLRFAAVLPRFLAYWLDVILVGIVGGLVSIPFAGMAGGGGTGTLITTVVAVGLEFLYFFGLWTSSSRATLGMRLFKLQVGNAFDGRTLTTEQAIRRWVGLGLPLQLLVGAPSITALGSTLFFLWSLALLVSTAMSPTKQGIHDRFANSAIVQPVGDSGPTAACLILLVLLFILPVILIIGLIILGSQMSDVLSEMR